jgi:hypothetical protein
MRYVYLLYDDEEQCVGTVEEVVAGRAHCNAFLADVVSSMDGCVDCRMLDSLIIEIREER